MSNIHSKQTGTQVHKPSKFEGANFNSFLTNIDGHVGYVGGQFTREVTITPVADVSGSLNNTYFTIFSLYNTKKVAVYFNVAMNESFVLPDGYDMKIELSINTNATVPQITSELSRAILAASPYNSGNNLHQLASSTSANPTRFVLGNLSCNEAYDNSTGFSFSHNFIPQANKQRLIADATNSILKFEDVVEPAVKTLGTTGTTGAATLNAYGHLNIPQYAGGVSSIVAGTNVTISPSGGTGAVTINASGGGGETSFKTTTSWRGVINITESGRAATAYTFDNPVANRYEFNMNVGIGFLGAAGSIGGVPAKAIIPAARVNITTNGTSNYSWIGKILANATSVGGYLRLYKATLSCDGETPEGFTLTLLATVNVPAISQYGYFCFDVSEMFPVLLKGDIILPVFDGMNGANNLTYTNTLELTHA